MRITNKFKLLENKLSELNNFQFSLILICLVLVKNGVHPIGPAWLDSLSNAAYAFPEFESYFSFSILPIFLVKLLGTPSHMLWWLINALILLIMLLQFFWRTSAIYGQNFKKFLIVIITLPLFISPFMYLGHYDLLTITGALLAFQARNKFLIVVGALLASAANPEQAFTTSLCLLFVYLGLKGKKNKFIFLTWLTCSSLMLLTLNLFYGGLISGKRESIILNEISQVFSSSLGMLNLLIFSVFGTAWLLIFYILGRHFNRYLFIGVVLIPLFLTLLVLDHTRVGVAVGALPLLLLLNYLFSETDFFRVELKHFYTYFIVYLFIPLIFVDFDNSIRLPYQKLIEILP